MSSGGELFLDTTGLMVYKLQALDDLLEWILVKNINDAALFLGDNYSTYVKASDFPEIIPNSITSILH